MGAKLVPNLNARNDAGAKTVQTLTLPNPLLPMQSSPQTPDDLREAGDIPIEPTNGANDSELAGPYNVDNEPKKKRNIAIPAILGVVALLGLGLFLRSRGQSAPPPDPAAAAEARLTTVRVQPVTTGTIVSTLPLTGQLRSNQDVNINSKIAGQVERVYVDEGQRVTRGQLLISLGLSDLRQQVQSARANLESAQVRLEQARVGLPARVAQINNAVREAQTQVNSAEARLRQAELSAPTRTTNARSQVESARAAVGSNQARVKQARETLRQVQGQVNAGVESAQAALRQARAQLDQVRSGSRDQQVAQAQAQVGQAEAQVNLAQAQVYDAQTNLTRQQTLYQGGATARANVDAAQTALEVARANLQAAKASVESARQQLSLVREGSRTEEVRQAEQIVAQREAALNQARADLSRIPATQAQISDALGGLAQSQEALRQANSNLSTIPSAQEDVVQARQALNQARAQLQTAQANRAQIPVARADVPAAQAAVDAARSQLEQAQLNLGYAQIKSPVSGVVNTKSIDVGEIVSPGAALLNIVSVNDVIFEAQVPASQLGQIEVGQPAKITVAARNNQTFTGYVTEIIPVADPRLRQFRVRISLENAQGLTPGAFAQGVLQTQVSRNTLTVPTEEVRTGDGDPYVFVAVPDGDKATVKKRTVKIGAQAQGKTQILSGLSQGDMVIEGTGMYDDGQTVKLAKAR